MAEIKTNILPNFLVVGAAKCGTTSLYHYLKQHKDVYMSPIKEPNHFSKDINPDEFSPEYKHHEKMKNLNVSKYVRGDMKEDQWGAYVQSEEDYKLLFKFANGKKRIGEISNSYLYSKVASENIKTTIPGVKLIAILRNPVDRAYSHYLANIRDGRAVLPFKKELEHDMSKPIKGWGKSHLYIELGMYTEQIKRFKRDFGPDQFKILLLEDLKANTPKVTKEIFEFLNLDSEININFREKHNEARVPKNIKFIHFLTQIGLKRKIFRLLPKSIQPSIKTLFFKKDMQEKMNLVDRKWLNSIFANEIEALSKELNRDLSHWLVIK